MSSFTRWTMEQKFESATNIIVQRHILIPENLTIKEAVFGENPVVDVENLDDTFMIVACEGNIYELNLIASILFEHAQHGGNLGEAVKLVQDLFEISPDQAEADVKEFYAQMIYLGILKEA